MAAYNWVMCIFSAIIFVASSFILWDTPLYTNDCHLLYSRPWWPEICKAFYWSKFVEYLDTFFNYVRGGPVTYLHWIHHIGASVNLWFLIAYKGEPGWIFVWLNSCVHILMYCYYALSISHGDSKFLSFAKPFVTFLQIAQFITGFTFLWQYPRRVPCFRHDAYKMIGVYYYTWTYVGLVLLLFINFFLRSYLCPKKSSRPRESRGTPNTNNTGNGQQASKKENPKDK